MKVLQIVADGSPGGGTTHVLQILSGLSASYEMGLISQPGSYLLEQADHLISSTGRADLFSLGSIPASLKSVQGTINLFQPDLIHVHGSRAAYFLSLLRTSIPKVYTVHGYHFLMQNIIRKLFQTNLERIAANRHDFIILVSQYDLSIAKNYSFLLPSTPVKVIHNGIPIKDYQRGQPSSGEKVGFIGRMEYPKDPHLFLDVISELPEHEALMIGDGSKTESILREIDREPFDNLEFLGRMSHEDVLEYLPQLAVLVMTSRWEGLPIIALEAMRAGVPVVAINVGGLSEIIESGESGILVDSRDPGIIAAHVRMVLENESLRKRLASEGYKRIREQFSEERMLNEIKLVYESLLAE